MVNELQEEVEEKELLLAEKETKNTSLQEQVRI
jgi:hypothetical protein